MKANALPLLVAFSMLGACGAPPLPDPKILSIAPTEMVACEGTTVSVTVQAVLPTHLDYNKSQVTATVDLQLRIGPVAVGPGKYVNGGTLTAAVPPVLAPGLYDVGLQLWDQRAEAVLPSAFTVKPNPTLTEPGYSISAIADQRSGVPFNITFRALGPNAATFSCRASLSSNRGPISPSATGRFEQGVRTEQVVLDFVNTNPSTIISVLDADGNFGLSNPFRVNP